jgi:hypothetical protein
MALTFQVEDTDPEFLIYAEQFPSFQVDENVAVDEGPTEGV